MKHPTPLSILILLTAIACSGDPSTGPGNRGGDGDRITHPQDLECLMTSECPPGALCRDNECQIPDTCASNEDCGFDSECDLESRECVECLSGGDCASGNACFGNVCRAACRSSGDCGAGLSCAQSGYCAECSDDRGCAADEHCDTGRCVPDECVARSSRCEGDSRVVVCSERGDSEIALQCPPGDVCGEEQGSPWCQSWVCTPGQSRCLVDENVVEHCSENGLTVASLEDCTEAGALCEEGACRPVICDALDTYCKDGHVFECSPSGTSDVIFNYCEEYEYCDSELAICRTQVCNPGQVGCDLGQVAVCDDIGSAFVEHTPCGPGETCDGGSCDLVICEPSERFCLANDVLTCNALGTAISVWDACTDAEYCNDTPSLVVCSPDLCPAGEMLCSGDAIKACNQEGSGFEPGGVDCSASGQICHDAACKTVICEDSERVCGAGGNVFLCIDEGTATELYDVCEDNEYCDAQNATCRTQVCTPNSPGCAGQVAFTCNSDGSGWIDDGDDCTTWPNHVCEAGSCNELVCTPGTSNRYCDGENVMGCSALGTAGFWYWDCGEANFCFEESNTTAYCTPDVCTPGEAYCEGEVAVVCADNGSGPTDPGTDCAAQGEACWQGNCHPIICSGEFHCSGQDLYSCEENGTVIVPMETCPSDQFCDELGGDCFYEICTPGETVCAGTNHTIACDSVGTRFGNSVSRCSSGEVCSNGSCVDPDTACSVSGKAFGPGLTMAMEGGSRTTIGADMYGNIHAAWSYYTLSTYGYSIGTYHAAEDSWTFEHSSAQVPPYIAVSPTGDAVLIEGRNAYVRGRFYDPRTREWSAPELLSPSGYNGSDLKVVADARGRFAASWENSTAAYLAFYHRDTGWEVHENDHPNTTPDHATDLFLTPSGVGIMAWDSDNSHYHRLDFVTFNLNQRSLSNLQSAASNFDDVDYQAPHVVLDNLTASERTFLIDYFFHSDGVDSRRWTSDTGWSLESQIVGSSGTAWGLEVMPSGALVALVNDTVFTREIGGAAWLATATTTASTLRGISAIFPRDEVLLWDGTPLVYTHGSGLGSSLALDEGLTLDGYARLPGCRAVAIGRDENNLPVVTRFD